MDKSPPQILPKHSNISPIYTFCSREGSICHTGSSTKSLAFAADDGTGSVHYRNITNEDIKCDESFFGNPSVGHPKSCWIASLPTDIEFDFDGKPSNFHMCASEGEICKINDSKYLDILYGADGKYNYINGNNILCTKEILGDPNFGLEKKCYYRTINRPLLPIIPIKTKPHKLITPTHPITQKTIYKSKEWLPIIFFITALFLTIFIIYYLVRPNKIIRTNINTEFHIKNPI